MKYNQLTINLEVQSLSAEVIKGHIEDLGYTVTLLEKTLTPGNVSLTVTVIIPSPIPSKVLRLNLCSCTCSLRACIVLLVLIKSSRL